MASLLSSSLLRSTSHSLTRALPLTMPSTLPLLSPLLTRSSFHSTSLALAPPPATFQPPAIGSPKYIKESWSTTRLVPVIERSIGDADILTGGENIHLKLPTLKAKVRTETGSKHCRELRKQHFRIPGIICDRNAPRQNQLLIDMDRFELENMMRPYNRTMGHKVCLIEIEGQPLPIMVIPDEICRHPVTEEIENVNWFIFRPFKDRVRINMPVVYTGTEECLGVKKGGIIVILRDSIPMVWTGGKYLPPFLHIDFTNVDLGRVFSQKDLKLPQHLSIFDPSFNYTLASVVGSNKARHPSQLEEDAPLDPSAGGASPAAASASALAAAEKEKREKEKKEDAEMAAKLSAKLKKK